MPPLIKIYDGGVRPITPKVVVFDLDETIGNFSDLYSIWTVIFTKHIYRGLTGGLNAGITGGMQFNDLSTLHATYVQGIFNELLDLYPEFLRYGILNILDFLKRKIQNGESHRIYLYTNNQCGFSTDASRKHEPPTQWVEMIIMYLNLKMRVRDTIFAKPVCAFKIDDRIVEPLRESHKKSHREFLKCSVLPKHTEICFIDDTYHSKMCHDKVYYVQPPPYFHNLGREEIIERFLTSDLYRRLSNEDDYLASSLQTHLPSPYKKTPETSCNPTQPVSSGQQAVYEKMMYYIKEFFCMSVSVPNTKKRKSKWGKFTRKNR